MIQSFGIVKLHYLFFSQVGPARRPDADLDSLRENAVTTTHEQRDALEQLRLVQLEREAVCRDVSPRSESG